ncbi:hypothetical protein [Amycolatopsis kentuckyensis]|uniref:hypothetical protein n=1 Tax=Amycolatopsis kentuckyensis TaxID=218823 RepID=UPI00356B0834
MPIDPGTRFVDLAERETQSRDSHVNTVARLTVVAKKRTLSSGEQAELDLSNAVLAELAGSASAKAEATEVCDPLFVATRTLLNEQKLMAPELRTHENGVLVFDPFESFAAFQAALSSPNPPKGALPITLTTLTLGLLMVDGAQPPPVAIVPQRGDNTGSKGPVSSKKKTIYPNWDHPDGGTFTRDFFQAVGEARSYGTLADQVLALLAIEGDPDGPGGVTPTVRCEEFARVMRGLAKAKVRPNEPQLRRKVNEQLNKIQNIGFEDDIADSVLDLPDLDQIFDQNIVTDNVRAMGAMIVSAMFEELKVFQVVDSIVEQFQHGDLPIGPGEAGRRLYRYWRDAPNRMSEQERRNFASITLGIPGGDPGGQVNREFNDLWLRFVSSVSSFVRQSEVDSLLRSGMPSPISHQQVRKAARDLASNLSLHGYGMAHYAAREIQFQVNGIIKLLGDPEILGCYGAKDMWQVVDQVATYYLGGARTSSRYRTLASCGTIITAWLAGNVTRIHQTSGPLIDIDVVRNPPVAGGHKATRDPNDYDLVNACELWLADTATSDSEIERLAQEPRTTPTMTSKPIPIPAMAREMLDGLGDVGIGLGHGYAPLRADFGAGNGHARTQ